MERAHERPSPAVWAGLATVYVGWGSTFMAVDLAVRTIPPLLMMSVRHLVAGSLMLAWAWRRGALARRPTRREWAAAAAVGGCLFLVSHGSLAWAQQTVPSGVAALVAGTIPLWMAVVDRVAYGQRLSRAAVAGLALGFAGLLVLVGVPGSDRVPVVATLVIVGGAISWAAGSLYSRGAALPADPILSAGMSALAGGTLLAVAGAVGGEVDDVQRGSISGASLGGLLYLIVVGSVIAFTVYVWLLRTTRTSLVSTYAYVNPVIAVLLGWALLDEPVTWRVLVASAAIVCAVLLIVSAPAVARAHARREDSELERGIQAVPETPGYNSRP
jgi:drug/metabolite transporter (DMT)-like permease